jgi:hypothetical protein
MEEVWSFVTPTEEGVDTTERFRDALQAYLNTVGIHASVETCDIPEARGAKPELRDLFEFLHRAMEKDAPVAFLNLCNGEEVNLEAWHWVTVVSMEYTDDLENIQLYILDESMVKQIDLILWYKTTVFGGGFVYLNVPDE